MPDKTTGERIVEEWRSSHGYTDPLVGLPDLSRRIDEALITALATAEGEVENPVYRIVFADQDVGDHIIWIEGDPGETKRLAYEAFEFHQRNWNCKLMVEIANRPEHIGRLKGDPS